MGSFHPVGGQLGTGSFCPETVRTLFGGVDAMQTVGDGFVLPH